MAQDSAFILKQTQQKTAYYLFELTKISLKKSDKHSSLFKKTFKTIQAKIRHLPLIFPVIELTIYIFELIFANPVINKESYLNFFNMLLSRWITMLKSGSSMPQRKIFCQSIERDSSHFLVTKHRCIQPFLIILAEKISKMLPIWKEVPKDRIKVTNKEIIFTLRTRARTWGDARREH